MNDELEPSSSSLLFSDNAVAKVKVLLEEEGNFDLEIVKGGVKLVVDAMSIQYLAGSTVDYVEGLQGSRFTVENPNASSTCGCGSSFSI